MDTNLIFCWLITVFIGIYLTWKNNNDVINLNKTNYQTLSIYEANSNLIEYITCTFMMVVFINFFIIFK